MFIFEIHESYNRSRNNKEEINTYGVEYNRCVMIMK